MVHTRKQQLWDNCCNWYLCSRNLVEACYTGRQRSCLSSGGLSLTNTIIQLILTSSKCTDCFKVALVFTKHPHTAPLILVSIDNMSLIQLHCREKPKYYDYKHLKVLLYCCSLFDIYWLLKVFTRRMWLCHGLIWHA